MDAGLMELLGLMLGVVSVGLIIGGCALVAPWLALLVGGVFGLFVAAIAVYLANQKAAKAKPVRSVA